MCLGYVAGVIDALYMRDPYHETLCLPEGLNSDKALIPIMAVIRAVPEFKNMHGVSVIMGALAGAYPCPEKPET